MAVPSRELLLTARRPTHSPLVCLVEVGLVALDVTDFAIDVDLSVLALQQRNRAHRSTVVAGVQTNLDLGS